MTMERKLKTSSLYSIIRDK
nr:unnamed protein product [Callosobruchus chinensis]